MLPTVIILYYTERPLWNTQGRPYNLSNITKQVLTSILLNSVPKLLDAKNMTTLEELGETLTCRAMLVQNSFAIDTGGGTSSRRFLLDCFTWYWVKLFGLYQLALAPIGKRTRFFRKHARNSLLLGAFSLENKCGKHQYGRGSPRRNIKMSQMFEFRIRTNSQGVSQSYSTGSQSCALFRLRKLL